MNNLSEVLKFISYWKTNHRFEELWNVNNSFEANIIYEFDQKLIDGVTTVRVELSGFDNGKVSLYERCPFTSKIFHLEFNPKFQNYKFDKEDRILMIEGSSSMMHGAYKVTINPLVSEDE